MKLVEVILRTCDKRNVHTDWRVRYVNMPKKDIILGCLKSLKNACLEIDGLKLTILDDHSTDETVNSIHEILNKSTINYEFISLKENGYNHSAHQQFLRCRDSEYEFVYSAEDDYLHVPSAISEMIDSFRIFKEKIPNSEIVLYPFDTPEVYHPPKRKDFIVHGSKRHWRTGDYTTNVIFTNPKIFKEYWTLFEILALKYNGDYLSPRTEHYDEENTIQKIWQDGQKTIRFNPIPSLALHLQFDNQIDPYIDWKQWWDDYAK